VCLKAPDSPIPTGSTRNQNDDKSAERGRTIGGVGMEIGIVCALGGLFIIGGIVSHRRWLLALFELTARSPPAGGNGGVEMINSALAHSVPDSPSREPLKSAGASGIVESIGVSRFSHWSRSPPSSEDRWPLTATPPETAYRLPALGSTGIPTAASASMTSSYVRVSPGSAFEFESASEDEGTEGGHEY